MLSATTAMSKSRRIGCAIMWCQLQRRILQPILWLVDISVQLLDTAQQYKTERGVGEGIRRAIEEGLVERKDLFVTTKYPPKDQPMEEVVVTHTFFRVCNCWPQMQTV